jgi:hypothetical protein
MSERYMFQRQNYNDYFIVSVSKTNGTMANELHKFMGKGNDKFAAGEVMGAVRPMLKTDKLGRELFAICFLNEENMTLNIIAYECMHVAFVHERIRTKFKMSYDDVEDEERVCYLFGDIFESVMKILKENKHIDQKIWKDEPVKAIKL